MAEDIRFDELEKGIPRFKRAQELPDKFIAKVVDANVTPDKTGRKCLFLTLELTDGSTTKIKYTPMHISDVVEAFQSMGFSYIRDIIGQTFTFITRQYRIGFPRPMPVELVSKKKGEKA